MIARILPLVLILSLTASSQQGKTSPQSADGITWCKSWAEATQEASVRNVPILFAVHKDKCGECIGVEKGTYPNAGVVAASRGIVCIVGHMETGHGANKTTKACSIYSSISCEDHVAVAKDLYGKFFNGSFGTPVHIWCDNTGKELSRASGKLDPAGFTTAVEKALAAVPGVHVSKADYDSANKLITEGETCVNRKEIRKAIEAFTKVSKMKIDRIKALGEEHLITLDTHGQQLVDEAKAIAEANADEAKQRLKSIIDEYKGLTCSKTAAQALSEIK